ncbi:MAG TPA: hypothetical protein VN763_15990, partial [Saprospiraceae bacterium]|nr:hypothetical protein [Saprospiraceae bacterium]
MKQSILLVSPPFSQLNTPYPATAYLKGYLNTQSITSTQMDLGIETILQLFSKKGLTEMFATVNGIIDTGSANAQRIYALQDKYLDSIDPVIHFLQDGDPTLSHFICGRNFLPEASKFEQLDDFEWAFGTMGTRDQARHIATLYLEDIVDFIQEMVDPLFGLSRYAERLGMSAHSFDNLYATLHQPPSFIAKLMLAIFKQEIEEVKPTVVCLSVPFPGNLLAALTCGQWLKQNHPQIQVVMGGGYPNTELRSLSDPRVFEFVDFICLDDGETPLMQILAYLDGRIELAMLKRSFTLVDGSVTYTNGSLIPDVK